ncbi:sialoadhesin-like [Colossoma macropomum]|uniref:sialoadhesin-like n=1 Tax=Colossoma macropomum TaxID=42526 RepID=UPI0018640B21|nr:sialoadhesin-like [Colossoma macropomum]
MMMMMMKTWSSWFPLRRLAVMTFSCGSVMMLISVCDVRGSGWSANVPSSVSGVSGLCVHIPCSFTYPGAKAPADKLTGIWFQGNMELQVYNSRHWELVDALFLNRTRLLGSLDRNDCSLKIGLLGSRDAHKYTFRIEIEGRDQYTYKDQPVTLSVSDSPPAPSMHCPGVLAEGVAVSLVCAVLHNCPDAAPALRWSSVQAEQAVTQSQGRRRVEQGWEERAVLNLLPSAGTHGELLHCSAVFPNGLMQRGPECRLVVNYAPKTVVASVLSPLGTVSEGDTVILSCQADSHPVPHLFSWFQGPEGREQLVKGQRGQELSVEKIARNAGPFWCEVENSMGSARSQPLGLDVLYEPEVMKESWCSVTSDQEEELSCECVAYGNPLPSIHWTVLHSDEWINGHMNVSQSEGHKSVVNLSASPPWNHTTTELVILCVAENSLASTSRAFTLTRNTTSEVSAVSTQRSLWSVWAPLMCLGLTVMVVLAGYLLRSRRAACLMKMEPTRPEML